MNFLTAESSLEESQVHRVAQSIRRMGLVGVTFPDDEARFMAAGGGVVRWGHLRRLHFGPPFCRRWAFRAAPHTGFVDCVDLLALNDIFPIGSPEPEEIQFFSRATTDYPVVLITCEPNATETAAGRTRLLRNIQVTLDHLAR